jgi:hypothetical protein
MLPIHPCCNKWNFLNKFVGIVTNVSLEIVTNLFEHHGLVISHEIESYSWKL